MNQFVKHRWPDKRGPALGPQRKHLRIAFAAIGLAVQTAIRYLNVTASGRQWIANLYSNVFRAERDIALSGPQT